MNAKESAVKKLFALAALSVLTVTPALADCNGSHALDRCLVGTWKYTSGGAAEWLNRNNRMAHVTGVDHGQIALTFRPDGSFATNTVDIHATVTANDHSMSGSGHTQGQASGTWSAAGGQFTLCTAPSSLHTKVTVVVHGRPISVDAPPPAHPHATAYTCNATTMTTTTPIPGHGAIVTTYSRAH